MGYKVESSLSVNNTEIIRDGTESVIDCLMGSDTSGIFELNRRATRLNLLNIMLSDASAAAVATSAKMARVRENAVTELANEAGDLVFNATRVVSDILISIERSCPCDNRVYESLVLAHRSMISILEKVRKYISAANEETVAEYGGGSGAYVIEMDLLQEAIKELRNPRTKGCPDYVKAAKESPESKEKVISVLAEDISAKSKRLTALLSQFLSVICAFSFRNEIFGLVFNDSPMGMRRGNNFATAAAAATATSSSAEQYGEASKEPDEDEAKKEKRRLRKSKKVRISVVTNAISPMLTPASPPSPTSTATGRIPKESTVMENVMEFVSIATTVVALINEAGELYNASKEVAAVEVKDKLSLSLTVDPDPAVPVLQQKKSRKFRPLGKTANFDERRPNETTPMCIELKSAQRGSWYKFHEDGFPKQITLNKLVDLIATSSNPEVRTRLTDVTLCMLPAYTNGSTFVTKLIERFTLKRSPSTPLLQQPPAPPTSNLIAAEPVPAPTTTTLPRAISATNITSKNANVSTNIGISRTNTVSNLNDGCYDRLAQERVCKVLKQLVETQFHVLDKRSVNDLTNFLKRDMSPAFPQYAEEISTRICVQLERREREISALQVPAFTGALNALSERMTPLNIFRAYDERTIAEQLRLISTRLVGAIRPREFVYLAWANKKPYLMPNISRCLRWNQALSEWVGMAVLGMKDEWARAEMFRKIVRIVTVLLDEHDYNDACTLYTGLNQPSVVNLNEIKGAIAGDETLERLNKIFKPDSAFAAYREEIAKYAEGQAFIPIFHVYINNFISINEGSLDKVNEMINFEKYAQYYDFIQKFFESQNYNFRTPRIEPLYSILKELSAPSNDIRYWLKTTYNKCTFTPSSPPYVPYTPPLQSPRRTPSPTTADGKAKDAESLFHKRQLSDEKKEKKKKEKEEKKKDKEEKKRDKEEKKKEKKERKEHKEDKE